MNSKLEAPKIIFANYCILSWSYINILPFDAKSKKALYIWFCNLLVSGVKNKVSLLSPASLDFAYSFVELMTSSEIFESGNKKIVLDSSYSPWSFPGCPINLDESLVMAISQFIPGDIRVSNFWYDCVIKNPSLKNFFSCSYDIIFSNDAATKIHRFYVDGSSAFSRFLRRACTFLCDLNSFLIVFQHHVHAMVISFESKAGFDSSSARSYLATIPVCATTGWGVGDIITDYPVINYYVPQALLMHCKTRPELEELLSSLWDISSDSKDA